MAQAAAKPDHIFAVISFFSLAFIFGTPLYALLYYGLPFINQLHTPFRWIFPLTLCVAVLARFGADYLAATREQKRDDQSLTPPLNPQCSIFNPFSSCAHGRRSLPPWPGWLLGRAAAAGRVVGVEMALSTD